MILVSQDGLRSIPVKNVCFFCIEKQEEEYVLWVMPNIDQNANMFGLTSLFRHKNVEVVKRVLRALLEIKTTLPADADCLIDVDIPALYKYGMDEIPKEMLADDSDDDWYVSDDILKLVKKLKKYNRVFALGIKNGSGLSLYCNGDKPTVFSLISRMGFVADTEWENIEQANVLLNLKEAQNESHD